MFELLILGSQALSIFLIAAWLTSGVYDNIRYPANNEHYTAQVVSMELLRDAFPQEFARVGDRAIRSRTKQKRLFWFVVFAEVITVILLWAGCGTLLLAIFENAEIELARSIALLGAMAFTSIWAGFLIAGNYFCYWYCHEGIQNTHYQMTLWGMTNVIFLVLA
ncbi:MAG: DUF2165 family protein [Aestuariivita sp.]|nr:DUF2165 family protein [Aestuariivita sp.]MCY4203273.1 DUF2165 family protein [Aestuariivita sp.]